MTKINIGSKNGGYIIDEGFGLVLCDIQTIFSSLHSAP
jgi:hypothetical protein